MGHSDFATYDQCGNEADTPPVIPYSVRYEPNSNLSYNDTEYTRTFHEYLSEVPVDTLLYTVYAQDRPKSQGGTEQKIGEIYLRSELVTSKWADEQMFFRHQRHDDDYRQNAQWETTETDEVNIFLLEGEAV